MRVLGIDTSTSRLSVAMLQDGVVEYEVSVGDLVSAQIHAEELPMLIQQACKLGRPDLIGVGVGPGPYTGLRVGIMTASALATAWNIPIVGISSLAALAHSYRQRSGETNFIAILDVKRREIAWQRFDTITDGPQLISISNLAELPNLPLVGPAFVSQTLVRPEVADTASVSAVAIAQLATAGENMGLQPLYLRQPDAAEPKSKAVVRND